MGQLQHASSLPACKLLLMSPPFAEGDLQATCYLNKLPPSFAKEDRILVADCLLATGGTLSQARCCREICCSACCVLTCRYFATLNGQMPSSLFLTLIGCFYPNWQVLDDLVSRGADPGMIRVVRWVAPA